MKILVTGGAGFLGSHLCETLLAQGHEVICVDNFVTGNERNIEHFKSNLQFRFINHDVSQPLPQDIVADQVYHLASPASPNHHSAKSYHALPFETMLVNTTGTWQLANFCLAHNASLLFASTSEVYGDPIEHPQKESYKGNVSSTGPRSVYDEAKRFGETIVAAFVRSRNLNGRIVRLFNTYGPRMALDDGRVVIEFATKALKNEPLPVFGDGTQTRSFCYVDDLIAGLIAAMNTENTVGQIYNLGNPQEFTVLDLAQKVKALTGSQSELAFTELLPQDDPKKRQPDITQAREHLKWEPKVTLDEGLVRLLAYLKQTGGLAI